MALLAIGLIVMIISGALAWLARARSALSRIAGGGGVALGCGIALIPTVSVLSSGAPLASALPWFLPLGSGALGMDALSALFACVILVVSGLAALYGIAYLQREDGHRATGVTWLFFSLLVASMVLVTIARDGVLFLLAWEVMTFSSFALVVFEHQDATVRRAGLLYLVAAHVGTACLLVLFLMLANGDPTLAFDNFSAADGTATAAFILAMVGFGTKAGFFPLHVWLPEAHSSAPSHVSAVMSGVMLKTGIYGLCRLLPTFGTPQQGWGVALMVVGATSGIGGVLYALAQHDIKRLLAYHSVENIGIIAMGMGLGLFGQAVGSPTLAWLGWGAALLHVVHTALFKSLLFMGAGAVFVSTGTRDIDRLGGLARRMPAVAALFLLGAIAISGLPPLNGFISEFLLYLGAWQGLQADGIVGVFSGIAVVLALALIGGLAAACFTKVFGIVFLGEPRTECAAKASRPPLLMVLPMAALSALCAGVALCAPWVVSALAPAWNKGLPGDAPHFVAEALTWVSGLSAALLVIVLLLWLVRRRLGRKHTARTALTWDCGYAAPTVRMQYTASSFAQPITDLFRWALKTHKHREGPKTILPARWHFRSHTEDLILHGVFQPVISLVERGLRPLRLFQRGKVQLYLMYMLITLMALLLYQMGF